MPAPRVTVAGESALWVDPAEIPADDDIGKLGRALAAGRRASAFGYSDLGARTVHLALNPYGVGVRESRDSAEHPASLAIAVPRKLQAKLPQLVGLLLGKGYAPTAWCSGSDRRRRPRVLSRRGRWGGRCAGS